MSKRFPQNGKYTQPNKGDITGDLLRTTNIDLKTNPGLLRLSPRLVVNVNSLNVNNMGVPLGFVVHSDTKYWAACGIGSGSNISGSGTMLTSASTTPSSLFASDNGVTSNSPTTIHADFSDIVEWQKTLLVGTYVTNPLQRIAQLSSGTWTPNWFGSAGSSTTGTFVTTGSCKNMCPGFNGNLYICDDYKVIYITPAGSPVSSGAGTVNSQSVYRPIWIRSTSNRLWIGLMTLDSYTGTAGYVAEWDGSGTAFNRIYKIDAPCALSCTILNDIPHIIDAYGVLKKFTGSGFTEVARLPVANLNIEMPGIYNDLTNARWIHHRGMDLVDGKINIAVNNKYTDSTGSTNYVKEMPSGIWEYDESTGSLYHKNSPCSDITDWGQQTILTSGALFGTKRNDATYLAGFAYYVDNASTSRIAIFYNDIATNTNKRSAIETIWTASNQVEDSIQDLIYRFRTLPSGDKIIGKYRLAKDANLPFIASITWTSTTTFTSTDSNMQYVLAGNEVEVVMGTGASTTAHITVTPVNSSGTYTVTLDEAIGPASGSGKAMFTNYKKGVVISSNNIQSERMRLGEVSNNFQVKTEFRGTNNFEVDDITIKTKTHQSI